MSGFGQTSLVYYIKIYIFIFLPHNDMYFKIILKFLLQNSQKVN